MHIHLSSTGCVLLFFFFFFSFLPFHCHVIRSRLHRDCCCCCYSSSRLLFTLFPLRLCAFQALAAARHPVPTTYESGNMCMLSASSADRCFGLASVWCHAAASVAACLLNICFAFFFIFFKLTPNVSICVFSSSSAKLIQLSFKKQCSVPANRHYCQKTAVLSRPTLVLSCQYMCAHLMSNRQGCVRRIYLLLSVSHSENNVCVCLFACLPVCN